MAYQMAATAVT